MTLLNKFPQEFIVKTAFLKKRTKKTYSPMNDDERKQYTINSFDNKMSSSGKHKKTNTEDA